MAAPAIPPVSLVCYDLAGIVVDDEITQRAFAEAIATLGIVAGTEAYTRSMVKFDRSRGRSPAAVLREVFADDEMAAKAASLAFDRSFSGAVERFGVAASPEVLAPFGKVSSVGLRVCPLSTLSRRATGALLGQLRRQGPADLTLCADDVPRGFPWPDLVLTALLRAGASDVREVAVVSATEAGLLAGHRAGAGLVVGVTRDRKRLPAMRKAGATHILDDVAGLSDLLLSDLESRGLHSEVCRNCRKSRRSPRSCASGPAGIPWPGPNQPPSPSSRPSTRRCPRSPGSPSERRAAAASSWISPAAISTSSCTWPGPAGCAGGMPCPTNPPGRARARWRSVSCSTTGADSI